MKQSSFFSTQVDQRSYNPEKLRLARQAAGISLAEIGELLSVTRQYAHRLENDSTPSDEQLKALSKLLQVSESFFLGHRIRAIETDQCHFRSLRSSTQTIKKMVMAQVEIFEHCFLTPLLDEIDLPKIKIGDIGNTDISTVSAIEKLAESFRREQGLGLGPISNVIKFSESIGCVVLNLSEADDRIDAFSIFNDRPIVVRNITKQSPGRLRFDIAHEIGHLIMHQGVETGCRKTESQANDFASAFLMPRTSFSAEFPRMRGRNFNWDSLIEFKARWGVSLKAIIYRAQKLGLITPEKAKSGFTYLSRSGQARSEPSDSRLTAEVTTLVQRAIDMLDMHSANKLIKSSGLTRDSIQSRYSLTLPPALLEVV
ncbi:helix-turn-helix domain-containing protein [Teredinibacter haidensis]|uniref:helix-turn-helix domain-containing protein n=1 Tax=Teredinibacter haidensis TaxID=2731755 RepID=UPI0009489730|nr:XRE family transcriptional regulator [Teredinibacter haidensis]